MTGIPSRPERKLFSNLRVGYPTKVTLSFFLTFAVAVAITTVVLLGAGRAAVFPTLVPPGVLLIGWIVLGSMPSIPQLIGLAIVLIGFRLTQRA